MASIAQDDPSPLPPEIPSDDPGEALSVSSKDRYSSVQACKGIRDPLHPVTTMHKRHRQTDRRTDTDIVAYLWSNSDDLKSSLWRHFVDTAIFSRV